LVGKLIYVAEKLGCLIPYGRKRSAGIKVDCFVLRTMVTA
jgi:hypothetical protein